MNGTTDRYLNLRVAFGIGWTLVEGNGVTGGFDGSNVPEGIVAEVLLEFGVEGSEFCEV